MAECQLPKLNTRVRFPSPAPGCRNSLDIDGGKPRIPSCFGFSMPKTRPSWEWIFGGCTERLTGFELQVEGLLAAISSRRPFSFHTGTVK